MMIDHDLAPQKTMITHCCPHCLKSSGRHSLECPNAPTFLTWRDFPRNGLLLDELPDGWYLGKTASNEYVAFAVNNDGQVYLTDHMNREIHPSLLVRFAVVETD